MIAGIDPSYQNNNAVAYWDGEKLFMVSGPFYKVADSIIKNCPTVVILEDSRLDDHIHAADFAYFSAVKKGVKAGIGAAAKTGRNVGKLDGVCQRWEEWLLDQGFEVKKVRPSSRRKGIDLKLSAEKFKRITGYTGTSNEHERDAAMLVFKRKL